MATEAQIDANRENARHSTGPVTDAGKAVASQNALKHGLRSANPIAPGEDPAEYTAFALELIEDLHAVGIAQRLVAERIAQLQWKLRRVPEAEWTELEGYRAKNIRAMQQATGKIKPPMPPGFLLAHNLGRMMTLQTYEIRIQRAIETAHRQLRELQREAQRAKEAQAAAPPAEPAAFKAVVAVPVERSDAPKLPLDQQLEGNWVRSSGSEEGVSPPGARIETEAVA